MTEKIIPRRKTQDEPLPATVESVDSSQEPQVPQSSEESTEPSVATKEVLELVNLAKEEESLVKTSAGTLLGKIEEQVDHIAKVIVTVPKRFRLTLDNHTTITMEPGVQKVGRFIADHWFSKANGVKVFEE